MNYKRLKEKANPNCKKCRGKGYYTWTYAVPIAAKYDFPCVCTKPQNKERRY